MSFAQRYLEKHTFLPLYFQEPPSGLLKYVVVIPAYREKNILHTLNSLIRCASPKGNIEILIIINSGEHETATIKKENLHTLHLVNKWIDDNYREERKTFVVNIPDLPKKHSGAGLARKIGMDAAISRFLMINKPDGFILSMDADTVVSSNYFTETEKISLSQPDISGIIYPFEHPLEGKEFPDRIYQAIAQYELYLRYFKLMLDYTGYPFGGYTIGSSFGIKAEMYAANGGMNKRKAGEDFYFLQKLFPLGSFVTARNTRVIPSPRTSHRVPFGTGPSVHMLVEENRSMEVYHPRGFEDLKILFDNINSLYSGKEYEIRKVLNHSLLSYLDDILFFEAVNQIRDNTSNIISFKKRFYRYFNAFQAIKYLNALSRNKLSKISIGEATKYMVTLFGIKYHEDLKETLKNIRKHEYGL